MFRTSGRATTQTSGGPSAWTSWRQMATVAPIFWFKTTTTWRNFAKLRKKHETDSYLLKRLKLKDQKNGTTQWSMRFKKIIYNTNNYILQLLSTKISKTEFSSPNFFFQTTFLVPPGRARPTRSGRPHWSTPGAPSSGSHWPPPPPRRPPWPIPAGRWPSESRIPWVVGEVLLKKWTFKLMVPKKELIVFTTNMLGVLKNAALITYILFSIFYSIPIKPF